VPIFSGGGTRFKILESLALGTPVISTSKGAEGLDLVHGHDILIANTPNEFLHHIIQVLDHRDLRDSLSNNGRNAVIQKYDWKNIVEEFEQLMQLCTQKIPQPL
jgi:glycosyltransferase involved in cell wall biosynthesis